MSYIVERRSEEKDRRRERIIAAAEELHQERGWEQVTMEAVARRAHLSRGLLYVRFPDRNALHHAIAARGLEQLHARMLEAVAGASRGVDKVLAMFDAYSAFAQDSPHMFEACARMEQGLLFQGETTPDVEMCLATGNRIFNLLAQALACGQLDGSVRKDLGESTVAARALCGFMHGVLQMVVFKARNLPVAPAAMMEQAHAFIMSAVASPPPS